MKLRNIAAAAALADSTAKDEIAAGVDRAIEAGLIAPERREWALTASPEAVRAYIARRFTAKDPAVEAVVRFVTERPGCTRIACAGSARDKRAGYLAIERAIQRGRIVMIRGRLHLKRADSDVDSGDGVAADFGGDA